MSKLNKIIYLVERTPRYGLIKYTVLLLIFIWAIPFSVSAKFDFAQPVLDVKPFAILGQPLLEKFVSDVKASALYDQEKLLSLLGFQSQKEEVKQPEPQFEVQSTKKVVVTAYSSTPDQTDSSPYITAMGSRVREGIVASNFLDFGTKVRLPEIYGDKVLVVEDRMARYNNHKVDVWMGSRYEALQFGVKRVTLEILK